MMQSTPATEAMAIKGPYHFRILSIGDDEGLRSSREMLLASEGYEVHSAESSAFLDVCQVRSLDLVILCQSVTLERAQRLAEILRRYNPQIRILRVASSCGEADSSYDNSLEPLAGPRAMLRVIDAITDEITSHRKPKARSQLF